MTTPLITIAKAMDRRPAVPAPNASGIVPMDLRVLIKLDAVQDKIGSVYIPDSRKEQEEWAQCKGTLVAIGELAFQEARRMAADMGIEFKMPQPGDRVLIAKNSGVTLKGVDGQGYRIMNDADVTARLEE